MFPLVLHSVPLLEPKQDSRANAEPYVRGGLLTKGSICVNNLRAQDGLATIVTVASIACIQCFIGSH